MFRGDGTVVGPWGRFLWSALPILKGRENRPYGQKTTRTVPMVTYGQKGRCQIYLAAVFFCLF